MTTPKKKDGRDARAKEKDAVETLRRHQRFLLDQPGVTSVGVGYRIKDGKKTNEVAIQVSVEKKLSLESLAERDIAPLPESLSSPDGATVPIDVVERSFRASYVVQELEPAQPEEAATQRRTLQDPMSPGISISHILGSAGTLGAIVYDEASGEPLVLSNWHVLHTPDGAVGDQIVQPGPYDDPRVEGHGCGTLLRSHLGMAGDCALARIENRAFQPAILELGRTPRRMADPDLDDHVVKSGRTTGVTYGIVTRIDVVAKINYGGDVGVQEIGGFEIRPNPDKPADRGEISMGGDSGSLWMVDVADDDDDADVAVGLHFAGETDARPSEEHAIACKLTSVAAKLRITLEPAAEHVVDQGDLWRDILDRVNRIEQRLTPLEARPACNCASAPAVVPGAAPSEAVAEAGIPVHGNWCGPGHGGGRAVDALDEVCMRHDQCYDRRGYLDCDCDRTLVREIDDLIARGGLSGTARAKAALVRTYFAAAPCVRHVRIGNRTIPLPTVNPPGIDPTRALRDAGRSLRRRMPW